jgi:hypothetical protein
MIIGQIEQMKIDQIAAGLADLNTSRPSAARPAATPGAAG